MVNHDNPNERVPQKKLQICCNQLRGKSGIATDDNIRSHAMSPESTVFPAQLPVAALPVAGQASALLGINESVRLWKIDVPNLKQYLTPNVL